MNEPRGDALLPSARPRHVVAPQVFASFFEMLGNNCEPGMVQRCFGAEPLGLFRFAGGTIAHLIDVIETEGHHLFGEDDVAIEITDEGEYFLTSRHYNDFPFHTFIYEKDVRREDFLKKRLPVIAYLKKRFFAEWREGDKIFVRMGDESRVELEQLGRILSRHAPRTLLNVAHADAFHPPGTVEQLGPGLWRGFVSSFKNFSRPEPFDLASWLSVLSSASSRAARGPRCRANRTLGSWSAWEIVEDNAEPCSRGQTSALEGAALVVKDGPAEDRPFAFLHIPLNLSDETLVVISVPVWLDSSYSGYHVHLSVDGGSELHQIVADPERRGCWQQAVLAIKVAAGQRNLTLGARAVVWPNSRVVLGAAKVETGVVPAAAQRRATLAPAVLFRLARRRAVSAIAAALSGQRRDTATLAREAIAAGAFVEADDRLSAALAVTPDDVALLKLYATSAHNSARHVAAIGRWQRALDVAPGDPMCFAGLACSFREFGIPERAWSIISAGLHHFPEAMLVLTEAARIATARRRHDEAVRFYDLAIALHGTHDAWTAAREEALAAAAAS